MKKIIIIFFIFFIIFKIRAQDVSGDNVIKTDNMNQNVNKVKNGWDYYNEARFYDSIKALLEEKRLFPDRINIYVILGWDYLNLKDYASMEKVSLEGLKLSPDDVRIIKNLIEAYFFQNKFSEAIPCLEKYIALRYNFKDPYISTVYYYLGVCYFKSGYYRKADISLSTALYYMPNDINAIIQLAEANEKLNQIEKAKNLLNNALKIQPNNTQAQDGLKRLENIKQ